MKISGEIFLPKVLQDIEMSDMGYVIEERSESMLPIKTYFSAPRVSPFTRCFCISIVNITTGIKASIPPAVM